MSFKPVNFLQLSEEEKKHVQTLNLPSLLFSRKAFKQLKSIKSESSVLLHAWHAMDHSVIDNATNEWLGRFRACVGAY